MRSLFYPICFTRMIFRTLRFRQSASGHTFIEVENLPGQPDRQVVLACETCHSVFVGWRDLDGNLHI